LKVTDVTLSDNARRLCQKFGVSENDLKEARAGSTSETPGSGFLIVFGVLPEDGRRVRLQCPHHMDYHITSWRPLERE
jgi:hypothetical protein